MAPIQYRVERNSLTRPASYKLRFLPQHAAGYDEVEWRRSKGDSCCVFFWDGVWIWDN